MFNPYSIILILFTLSGLVLVAWGWRVLQQSKKTKMWPKTPAVVTHAETPTSQFEDFAPKVMFRYRVDSKEYETKQHFNNISFSLEFCREYVAKFPAGSQVEVFYDPKNPGRATLEPIEEKGDWMILAVGIVTTVFGLLLLSV